MSFESIASARLTTQSVSVSKFSGSNKNKISISVNMIPEIFKELGWTVNDAFEFLWGNGDDLGFLKLVKYPRGIGVEDKKRTSAIVRITTQRVPKKMIEEKLFATEVKYKIQGQSLLITLPEYFYKRQEKEPEE